MFVSSPGRLLLLMKKKLILLITVSVLFVGCAPKSELVQARAEVALAQEKIRVLEEQRLASQSDLEKAKEEITSLRQRLMEMADEMKARETSNVHHP